MIPLSSLESIRITTSAAGAVDVYAAWTDVSTTAIVKGTSAPSTITTATTTTVVSAPSSGVTRKVRSVSVLNSSYVAEQTIDVVVYDGSTSTPVFGATLQAGERLAYGGTALGWELFDIGGRAKVIGMRGAQGPAGADGDTGPQGPAGADGSVGPTVGPALKGRTASGSGATVDVPIAGIASPTGVIGVDASSRIILGTGTVSGANSLVGAGGAATSARSIAWGTGAQATDVGGVAIGETAIASGPHSIAHGYDSQATSSYSVSIGAYNRSRAAASVAIGETLDIHATAANAVVLGYNSAVGANGTYGVAIGYDCRVTGGYNSESDVTGALALGISAVARRPGQTTISSGLPFLSDWQQMGMGVALAGVSGTLKDRSGRGFFPDLFSFGVYRIDLIVANANAAKRVRVVREVTVASALANIDIVKDEAVLGGDGLAIGAAELVSYGWTFAITEAAAGELLLTFNPGSDTVYAGATIHWQQLGGTNSIPA